MSHKYEVEYTDTFGGEANYGWVRRATISVPEWPHFKGWDGNGRIEPPGYQREVMRRAKAAVDLTGVRGVTERVGDGYEFRPYGTATILFVNFAENEQ